MTIQPITDAYRPRVNKILSEQWSAPPVISRGRWIDTTVLPGYVVLENGEIIGVMTYHLDGENCEIVTLNSLQARKGVGSALIQAVVNAARCMGWRRVWLVTTNDNYPAIGFYQKRGFTWAAMHVNAMDQARVLKPAIPQKGFEGIPLQHELEFEIRF